MEQEQDYTVKPDNKIGLAVAAIIFFLPLGIPALVQAIRAQVAWNQGRPGEAWRMTKASQTKSKIALGIGIPLTIAVIVFYVIYMVWMISEMSRPYYIY